MFCMICLGVCVSVCAYVHVCGGVWVPADWKVFLCEKEVIQLYLYSFGWPLSGPTWKHHCQDRVCHLWSQELGMTLTAAKLCVCVCVRVSVCGPVQEQCLGTTSASTHIHTLHILTQHTIPQNRQKSWLGNNNNNNKNRSMCKNIIIFLVISVK